MKHKKETPEIPKIKEVPLTMYLKCTLTDKEKIERGFDLAHKHNEKLQLEADMKSARSQYQSRIDAVVGEISSLSNKIREGAEFRDVECVKAFDWTEKLVTTNRLDTLEIIETRTMRQEELQTEINLKP